MDKLNLRCADCVHANKTWAWGMSHFCSLLSSPCNVERFLGGRCQPHAVYFKRRPAEPRPASDYTYAAYPTGD